MPHVFTVYEAVLYVREITQRRRFFGYIVLDRDHRFRVVNREQGLEFRRGGGGQSGGVFAQQRLASRPKLLRITVAWQHEEPLERDYYVVYHELPPPEPPVPVDQHPALGWQQHWLRCGLGAHLVLRDLQPLRRREFMPALLTKNVSRDRVVAYEDVRRRGYREIAHRELGVEHLKALARALARLHASASLADARQRSVIATTLRDKHAQLWRGRPFSPGTHESNFYEKTIGLVERIAERLQGRPRPEVREALQLGCFVVDMWQAHESRVPGANRKRLPEVLSVGPNWLRNLLFDASQPTNCLLDFTNRCYYAPRTLDLVNFLHANLPGAERRSIAPRLLACYCNEYNECLEWARESLSWMRHVEPSWLEPLEPSDLVAEYEALRLPGLFFALSAVPYLAIGSRMEAQQRRPEVEIEHDFHRKYFVNNEGLIELYEEDADYRTRIDELVGELLDYIDKHDLTPEFRADDHSTMTVICAQYSYARRIQFICFVAQTGYEDEPDVDEDEFINVEFEIVDKIVKDEAELRVGQDDRDRVDGRQRLPNSDGRHHRGHRVGARRSMARQPGAQVLHVLPVGAVRPRRREERAQSQRHADLLPAHPGLPRRGAERHQRVQGARQIFRDRRQLRVRLHLQQVLRRKIAKGEPRDI
ncbi:unnamed protein product [Trichogramma brassicae]|uniref:CHK kinase-like domain-containing protein n=1 Tax=Trichogramma brassicae TaxID=86971 RepID=A0A6H5J3N3_9HYME|nr:unnamed protein product [Trichogramma brassicae]